MKYKVLHQDKRQHGSSQKPYPERIIYNADNDEDVEREETPGEEGEGRGFHGK